VKRALHAGASLELTPGGKMAIHAIVVLAGPDAALDAPLRRGGHAGLQERVADQAYPVCGRALAGRASGWLPSRPAPWLQSHGSLRLQSHGSLPRP